jgi:hypothetical protein
MKWQTLDTPMPLADMRSSYAVFRLKPLVPCFLDLKDENGALLARPGIQVEFDDNTRLLIGNALEDGDVPSASDDYGLRMTWSDVGHKMVVRWRDLLA